MKKTLLSLVALVGLFAGSAVAQKQEVTDDYRRSSIALIMMDEENMPFRDIIRAAFLDAPLPDKYNDHNVDHRLFDPARLTITEVDMEAYREAVNLGLNESGSGQAPPNSVSS